MAALGEAELVVMHRMCLLGVGPLAIFQQLDCPRCHIFVGSLRLCCDAQLHYETLRSPQIRGSSRQTVTRSMLTYHAHKWWLPDVWLMNNRPHVETDRVT